MRTINMIIWEQWMLTVLGYDSLPCFHHCRGAMGHGVFFCQNAKIKTLWSVQDGSMSVFTLWHLCSVTLTYLWRSEHHVVSVQALVSVEILAIMLQLNQVILRKNLSPYLRSGKICKCKINGYILIQLIITHKDTKNYTQISQAPHILKVWNE